ncbi:hypothetical protein SLEP1_g43572 [Rubroshorea leprosula]|uniref:Uncharacterized protein n=1 Tax=Rubroshorea leprosula TaxID=152421 RepID=A0AAV5LDC3_9ROSI|nr:hypothetical protein SLEP1_g43572 [Rubroshorea leprosula]
MLGKNSRANLANVRSQEVSFNDEVAVAFEKKIVSFIVENAVKNELNKAYSKKAKKTRHSLSVPGKLKSLLQHYLLLKYAAIYTHQFPTSSF